ncbi:alcohol dehydrogenase [Phytophthora palmivora]|uniref:Alcohol dehydrogenase n=1 Tax=Phytophthora palmivora TaxID=4796 RepID=A0A2P4X8V6_9STRA|nr:alcohol dehydrogenase [Phytophthora palmivora]
MSSVPTAFKAFEFQEFGDALDVLRLNPSATLKPLESTQVCIKVHSAAVNPIDYRMLKYGKHFLGKTPSSESPIRSGFDVAGVVVAVGDGDVKGLQVGDEVYGMPDVTQLGTFAEYVNLDVKFLSSKPTNMSFNEAAGVPTVGETSYQSLIDYGCLKAGQCVLILGGGSSCGMFAIQIAKAQGAKVITTCSSRNTELAKSLGADIVVDYTQEKWGEVLPQHSVDLIFDCAVEPESWNNEAQRVLKPATGIFVTLAGARQTKDPVASPIGATRFCIFARSSSSYLEPLTKLIEAGKLKTVINSVYPLEELTEAIKEQMDGRVQGKIIIEVAKD